MASCAAADCLNLPTQIFPSKTAPCFILGRTRLIMDYERPYLTAHAVLQNRKVWGTGGNETLTLSTRAGLS